MAVSDKKKEISTAYLQLLADNQEDKISVKTLIEKCGISRQTFYYHFKDTLDVVEYTLRSIIAADVKKCCRLEDPKQAIRFLLESMEKSRSLIRKMESSSRNKEVERFVTGEIYNAMNEILEKLPSNIDEIRQSDRQFALYFFSYGILGFVIDAIGRGVPLDIDKLSDQVYRLYMGEFRILNID